MAKILIIDDEPMILAYMRKCLERSNHEVVELSNGKNATRVQSKTPIDLVITDIFMPSQDGLQTIISLRDKDPEMRIIAISGGLVGRGGLTQMAMLNTAMALGAVKLLAKPFDSEQLNAAVSSALAS